MPIVVDAANTMTPSWEILVINIGQCRWIYHEDDGKIYADEEKDRLPLLLILFGGR